MGHWARPFFIAPDAQIRYTKAGINLEALMRSLFPTAALLTLMLLNCSREMPLDQAAAWKPEQPLAGGELTLYYNPDATAALLKNAGAMTAELLQFCGGRTPRVDRLAMVQKRGLWQARFVLQPDARLLLLRFVADRTDDQQGRNWESLVYSSDGRPVPGAHLEKSLLLQRGEAAGFAVAKDLRAAETELEAELTVWPKNIPARTTLWDLLLHQHPGESTAARVRSELRQAYDEAGGDEETLAALLPFFFRTGQAYAARQIIEDSVALLPRGPVAAAAREWEISQQSDPIKKAAMIAAFQHDFPGAAPPQP